jgi:hypothetical protein
MKAKKNKEGRLLKYAARSKDHRGNIYEGQLYTRMYDATRGFRPENCGAAELVVYELVPVKVVPMRVALEKGHMVKLQTKFVGRGAQGELDV